MGPEAHQINWLWPKKIMHDWFRALRDEVCNAFEAIEEQVATLKKPAGRFERKSWGRDGGGGYGPHARPGI